MPGSRRMILNHIMSGLCTKMNRTKQLPKDMMETPLKRCLNTFDITLLGVGHMVGAGIYVLTGTVTKEIAGPGIIISFLLAGLASLLSALCYAEFGTKFPKAGSAYVYTYYSIGEFWAFVIGWNILLEHMIGAASVARAWSGYVDSLLGGTISNTTLAITGQMHEQILARYPDFLAFSVCIIYALLLGTGVKSSTWLNSVFTLINLGVIIVVITAGLWYAKDSNWRKGGGFLPYGFEGVIAGAATCFYAFIGFDCVAASGEEARTPSTSIPAATLISMAIVTSGYMLVAAALTLMVPYYEIDPGAALPAAFQTLGVPWLKYVVSLGALCGMTTSLFGSLFALPRCMYAMANDGLLFKCLASVNPTTQVPFVNLIISGTISALIALLFDLEKLVEFMSIGTLLAYTIVSISVIILRYRPTVEMIDTDTAGTIKPKYQWLTMVFGNLKPGKLVAYSTFIYTIFTSAFCISLFHINNSTLWALSTTFFFLSIMIGCLLLIGAHQQIPKDEEDFQVPLVPLIPAISVVCNIEFMVHLNLLTWLRFFIWMILGMQIYFLYGIHHSKEGTDESSTSSYSMLMTTPEADRTNWGSTVKCNVKGIFTRRRTSATDRTAIIDGEGDLE